MKKKMLLILPMAMVLAGCTWWNPLTWFKKDDQTEDPEDIKPEEMKQHANSITASPSAPFFLKVGEERKVSVSLSPTPTDEFERKFTWKLTGDSVSYTLDEEKGKSATIVGLKEGTSYLKVTNTYNNELTKTFTVKVFDFNPEKQYFWQFDKDTDKAKFEGFKDGIANLSGVEWDFNRAQSGYVKPLYNGLGFGKGGEPETDLKLKAYNSRPISSISIEAASANSLAKMSVKIGETTVLDRTTVSKVDYDKNMKFYDVVPEEPLAGDIEIHVETPEVDPSPEDSDTYKTPGAFWLKTIFINYADEPVYKTTRNYDIKGMYDSAESNPINSLNTTAKELVMPDTDEDFSITFTNIRKEKSSDAVPGYVQTNGDILIESKKSTEAIKYVELKLPTTETVPVPKNTFILETSRLGGEPYSCTEIKTDQNGLLKAYVYGNNISAIKLRSKSTTFVGLDYFTVKTQEGNHGVIDSLVTPESFVPDRLNYVVGMVFDTLGLGNLRVAYTDPNIQQDVLKPTDLEWFDGASYETNPATATKELKLGTTSVYGVYKQGGVSFTVKIEGITVEDSYLDLSLIKNVSEIDTSSKYYLIGVNGTKNLFLPSKGASALKNSTGNVDLGSISLEDNISITAAYSNDFFSFEIVSDKYRVKFLDPTDSKTHYVGMTNSGGFSTAQGPDNKDYAFTINADGSVEMMIQKSDASITKYLTFDGSKLLLSDNSSDSNIRIFKDVTVAA